MRRLALGFSLLVALSARGDTLTAPGTDTYAVVATVDADTVLVHLYLDGTFWETVPVGFCGWSAGIPNDQSGTWTATAEDAAGNVSAPSNAVAFDRRDWNGDGVITVNDLVQSIRAIGRAVPRRVGYQIQIDGEPAP